MAGTKEKGRAASRGRNRELVDIAAALFRDRGYDATSMQEIADKMGILKGSVYYYVDTKEDLLWMVVEPPLRGLMAAAEEILGDDSRPIADRLTDAIKAHARSFEEHYPHMFVMTRENGETLSKKRRAELDGMREAYFALWKSAIAGGVESGDLRADLDVSIAVHAIFGMLNWMFRWFKPGGRLTAEEVAAEFATILVSGIRATAPVAVR